MITNDPKKILLADDSIFFRTKLSSILTEAGHEIVFASDGIELLAKLEEVSDTIDLLILDLQMPHMDGFGVLAQLKKKGLTGKFSILVVTGVYEPGDVLQRVRSLGADGLLTKGFSPEQVLHHVHQLLYRIDEMRNEMRVPISIPVDFSVGEDSHSAFLLNINSSGLFLHTKTELETGTTLTIRFSLPGEETVFNVKGIVKWTTGSQGSNDLFCGAGVMFTTITDEERTKLRDFTEKETIRLGLNAGGAPPICHELATIGASTKHLNCLGPGRH